MSECFNTEFIEQVELKYIIIFSMSSINLVTGLPISFKIWMSDTAKSQTLEVTVCILCL